jgi:hypothetical protein
MHADVPPDAAGSGVFGWPLAMLEQDVGFPVPQGGAQNLAFAPQRRFESQRPGADRDKGHRGAGRRRPGDWRQNRRLRRHQGAPRGIADVVAPTLYRCWGCSIFRRSSRTSLNLFRWDNRTLKINWALDRPLRWRHPPLLLLR